MAIDQIASRLAGLDREDRYGHRRGRRDHGDEALHAVRCESLMMRHAYEPQRSEGAIKPPLFQTSTFAFRTAEEGKECFAEAYGLKEHDPAHPMGLVYSRINNPNLEILEKRLTLWDRAEASDTVSSPRLTWRVQFLERSDGASE